MKKGGVILLLSIVVLIILFFPLILAQVSLNTTSTTSSGSNQSAVNSATGINKAYLCLEGKVANTCGSLSTEEQIFSLLALSYKSDIQRECKDALNSKLSDSGCWPKGSSGSGCDLKTTAQATFAYKNIREDVKTQ